MNTSVERIKNDIHGLSEMAKIELFRWIQKEHLSRVIKPVTEPSSSSR